MTGSPAYTPVVWRTVALAVFTITMGLADAWLVAWLIGNVWGMAIAAGTIIGLTVSIAWAMRHYLAAAATGLLVIAVAMTILLARGSPSAGVRGAVVALAVFGVWFLAYDLWFTGRANAECVSPMITLGSDARRGRALIVYHQGRGPTHFQARMQRAFAEGLEAQGWAVDLTTASHEAPADVSRYDLLVLGAQAYNWCPARPVVDYVDRVAGLKGKPVVVVVSGGGMTERAMRLLQARVLKAEGVIADAIEIWTSRSNEERHGLTDPAAIMRRAASRVPPTPLAMGRPITRIASRAPRPGQSSRSGEQEPNGSGHVASETGVLVTSGKRRPLQKNVRPEAQAMHRLKSTGLL